MILIPIPINQTNMLIIILPFAIVALVLAILYLRSIDEERKMKKRGKVRKGDAYVDENSYS